MKIKIIRIPDQYKYGGELNVKKWRSFGGDLNNHGSDFTNGNGNGRGNGGSGNRSKDNSWSVWDD